MRVVVSKSSSVVVKPSEPVTMTGNINLSPYDKDFVGRPQTALLVFPRSIDDPAGTIKRGLSQALVYYHPISGRLDVGADGDFHIKCTGEGVLFVAASANCSMADDVKFSVLSFAATTLLDELAVYYPAEGCRLTDPLLMMQVTEFTCGGFILGVTWSHAIADAAGMGQFLQAVGELSRGLPSPSIAPVRRDDRLTAVVVPSSDAVRQCFRGIQPIEMAQLEIVVPARLIEFLRGGASCCTVFEAVSAVLWRCRTRAVISDPEAPTALLFSVNARKYAGAKEGYYGNCLAAQLVVATSSAVASGDLRDVVGMIRRAKDRIPEQFRSVEEQVTGVGPLPLGYNLFIVTCWRNLGLENADFGGGQPERVMSYKPQRVGMPTCFITNQAKDGGTYVFSGCVKDEHAQAFLAQLADLHVRAYP